MPPREIMPLIALGRRVRDENCFEATLQQADLIICELSSIRIVEYRNRQLQINHFRQHLSALGLSNSVHFKSGRDHASPLSSAGEVTATIDPFTRDLMQHGRCYEMTQAEIETAATTLVELIGMPMIFVCTSVRSPEGDDIRQRTVLRDAMTKVAARHPAVALFDPTDFVLEHDFDTVFRDLGHYHDAFIPTVAERLVSVASSFWRDLKSQGPASPKPPMPTAAKRSTLWPELYDGTLAYAQ